MKEIEQLISELEKLYAMTISCDDFDSSLENLTFDNLDNVYANIHHYLADEDIRSRDPEYKLMQENELKKLITYLKTNNYKAANQITFLHET